MRIAFLLLAAIAAVVIYAGAEKPTATSGAEAGASARLEAGLDRLKTALLGDGDTPKAALELVQQVGGAKVEKDVVAKITDAITKSRQAAVSEGVAPIPPAIRRRLDGFFPRPMLDRVRYRVGWGDARPKPPLAPLFLLPSTKAMTLGDVIIFRDDATAEDIRIWVHELGHVQQYDRWGVEAFAKRYAEDFQAVEDDAWAVFDRYDAWARERGRLAATGYEPVQATP